MFDIINAAVHPVSHQWENSTCVYTKDNLMRKFMDATPDQITQMWLRFDKELSTWKTEDHKRDIRNSTNKETNRLALYKQDLAKLKHEKWRGTIIIDFFIWKLVEMLVNLESRICTSGPRSWTVGSFTTCTSRTNNMTSRPLGAG
jgi:hypothetical protein